MNELVIGGKTYISSKRAAELTGYAKDYIGQLCREGYVEAKMVGRSWYVLESSIREHRFGKEEQPTDTPVNADAHTPAPAWESPTYVPEVPTEIPVLRQTTVRQEEVRETADSVDISTTETTITEMQAAWKEWFETRGDASDEGPDEENEEEATEEEIGHQDQAMYEEEAAEEEPEMPEEEEEEEEDDDDSVAIPVHKVREPRQNDIVPVRKAEKEPEMPVARVIMERPARVPNTKREKEGANVVATALLIAACGVIIAVGVIGSGFAESYLNENPVIRYLGGQSRVIK